jgi:hypothetical protein
MRNKALLLGVAIVVMIGMAKGESIFIAQTAQGSDNGVNPANAHAAAWFNTAGNWDVGTGKISPGDTAHLCGTITTSLIAQGNGINGSPITILFETNAKLSQPYCAACLSINNRSYLVVDGGTNGIIESNDNGTTLGNHQNAQAMWADNLNNVEIKNLTIQNIYVRTSPTDYSIDQSMTRCFGFGGSNILIHDNVMHDAGWCLCNSYSNGDHDVRVYNNDIYNVDHGYVLSSGGTNRASGFYFYNNHIHDYANWDSPANAYHHDGIHAFGVPDGQGNCPVATEFWVYNNIFDGNVGVNVTGHIFLEGGTGAGRTPWTDTTGTFYLINNIFNGGAIVGLNRGANYQIYNNSFVNSELGLSDSRQPKIKNNFIAGGSTVMSVTLLENVTINNSATDINYNVYADCPSPYNCFDAGNHVATSNFASWQSTCNCDGNAEASLGTMGGVDATGHPQAGSMVIGAGTNLTSVGINVVTADLSGKSRPATGAWDVGAYQYTTVQVRNAERGVWNAQVMQPLLPNPIKVAFFKQYLQANKNLRIYDLGGNQIAKGLIQEGVYFVRESKNTLMQKVAIIK